MSGIDTLEALRDAIGASTGPNREIDGAFGALVLGWPYIFSTVDRLDNEGEPARSWWRMIDGVPVAVPAFTDALAGPGALFAAARELWPNGAITVTRGGDLIPCGAILATGSRPVEAAEHFDLCRAIMLAMVAAKMAERDA